MSKIKTNKWAAECKSSPTLDFFANVQEMIKAGIQVYDFGVGEMHPEILVPQPFKDAMVTAIQTNQSFYVSSQGYIEAREALSFDFKKNFGLDYSAKQITICAGPKDALYKTCVALFNPTHKRNKAVLFAPTYELFETVPVLLTGIQPIILETDEHFYPDLQKLENLLASDDAIGVIFVNSPNNPTGAVYPKSIIEKMAAIIGKYPEIAVVFDEVYRTITYDDVKHTNIATYLPEQTLVVGGVSKEVAGTGIRLGYVAGPEEIVAAIAKVTGNASSCVNLPIQIGYAEFLRADQDLKYRHAIRDHLQKRRDQIISHINNDPLLSRFLHFETPKGAFYLFVDVRELYGKIGANGKPFVNDADVAYYLLEYAKVAVIPGSLFQRPHFVRLSYCKSEETIEKGLAAVSQALAQLK